LEGVVVVVVVVGVVVVVVDDDGGGGSAGTTVVVVGAGFTVVWEQPAKASVARATDVGMSLFMVVLDVFDIFRFH
jgi:hypothetical protein